MSDYEHILLAVDLTDESDQVAQRASALAQRQCAKLSIVHVIEPINFVYGGDIPLDLTSVQDQLEAHAKSKLIRFAQQFGIQEDQQHISVGVAQNEIHRVAAENDADLIVVGSHGRHGVALLLGSTANGVLHGAHCDVLAVRISAG